MATLPQHGREVLVRLLKCVLVGGILVSAGQAYADDDATSEIRLLKAKLKQLEQRVDDQGRKEKVFEAQAKAMPVGARRLQGPARSIPVPRRKGLLQGRYVDIRRLDRSHRHLPDPQPRLRYRIGLQLHSLRSRARISTRRNRASRRARPGSRSSPKATSVRIPTLRATAKSISKARRRPRVRLRPTRSIRGCASSASTFDRTDLGFHVLAGQSWSLNAPSKAGIDPRGVDAPGVIDFESVPGFLAARQPGIRVWQDIGPEFKIAASVENPADLLLRRQHADGRHAGGRTAGRVEPEPARQPDRSRRQLLQ